MAGERSEYPITNTEYPMMKLNIRQEERPTSNVQRPIVNNIKHCCELEEIILLLGPRASP
jgi:hypothetical protein